MDNHHQHAFRRAVKYSTSATGLLIVPSAETPLRAVGGATPLAEDVELLEPPPPLVLVGVVSMAAAP